MKDSYYIGLDIGTGSVGWAVTDEDYKLERCKGKDMWGVRLFDTAETAADRRLFRSARRAKLRKIQRLSYLARAFKDEICRKDPEFLSRMVESKFIPNLKKLDNKTSNILFDEKNFKDKNFYQKYPTIYHLRQALFDGKEDAFDVRLVYLALHHIFKNRGHFLYKELAVKELNDPNLGIDLFNEILSIIRDSKKIRASEILECNFDSNIEQIIKLLTNKTDGKKQKEENLVNLLVVDKKNKVAKSFIKILLGYKVALYDIFDTDEDQVEEFKKKKIEIDNLESNEEEYKSLLGDSYNFIEKIKEFFDYCHLLKLLSGGNNFSKNQIALFEKHNADIRFLRELAKNNQSVFDAILSDKAKDGYLQYIRKTTSSDKFYKNVLNTLKKVVDEEKYNSISLDIENGNYCPFLRSSANSVIPYQIHKYELEKILKNAEKYLPFLQEKDESNLTLSRRLIEVFQFQIPYYVGPLNDKSENSWVVREINKKVTPWNFNDIIDIKATSEQFIKKMTNKCSYLKNEEVLPKCSLLYTKYEVLNEISNIKINGQLISPELKQKLFNELFMKKSSVTNSMVESFFKINCLKKDDVINCPKLTVTSLKHWIDCQDIIAKPNGENIVEDAIYYVTVFPGESNFVREKLEEKYADVLNEAELKKLSTLKAQGWGRLSRKLLNGICVQNNEKHETIMDLLWNTSANLSLILLAKENGEKNRFLKIIEEENHNHNGEKKNLNEFLKQYNLSPSINRSINQAIKIVDEIVKLKKSSPTKIMVEVTREDGEKKETVSRKNSLLDKYNRLKNLEEYKQILSDLNKCSDADLRKNKDKLYLYFSQLGKDMYTGEPININDLDLYDIDHIYPQEKIKDDSFNNRVLVNKAANNHKTNEYPLPESIRSNQKVLALWEFLKLNNFINDVKYRRLVRGTDFEVNELQGFVARQLVQTAQAVKVVCEYLNYKFNENTDQVKTKTDGVDLSSTCKDKSSNTQVIYSKAQNVASFKQDIFYFYREKNCIEKTNIFVKSRIINHLHHAKDAYLNIVVGNINSTQFVIKDKNNKNNEFVIPSEKKELYNFLQKGFYAKSVEKALPQIEKVMQKNTPIVTVREYKKTGQFFKNMYSGSEVCKYPFKTKDARYSVVGDKEGTIRLGGYKDAGISYYAIIKKPNKKSKLELAIEPILIRDKELFDKAPMTYLENKYNTKECRYLGHILTNSIIKIDNINYIITGKTHDSFVTIVGHSLFLEPYYVKYIDSLEKTKDKIELYGKKSIDKEKFENDIKNPSYYIYNTSGLKITLENNLNLFYILVGKMQSYPFNSKKGLGDLGEFLSTKNARDNFSTLDFNKQVFLLINLVREFIQQSKIDLKTTLSLEKDFDRRSISFSEILNNGTLVYNSVTGLLSQEIKISDLDK